MSVIVSDTGKDFERIEPGLHHAVCSHVLDLGLHETKYGFKRKVALCFELAEKMQDGRPFMQSALFTASLNEKALLRQQLESWRGKKMSDDEIQGFDVERLLGVNCMLNIVEDNKNGKNYTNITAIIKPPAGQPVLKPVGQPAPEWLRKMQAAGLERVAQMDTPVPPARSGAAAVHDQTAPPHTDDDAPAEDMFSNDASQPDGLPF